MISLIKGRQDEEKMLIYCGSVCQKEKKNLVKFYQFTVGRLQRNGNFPTGMERSHKLSRKTETCE